MISNLFAEVSRRFGHHWYIFYRSLSKSNRMVCRNLCWQTSQRNLFSVLELSRSPANTLFLLPQHAFEHGRELS